MARQTTGILLIGGALFALWAFDTGRLDAVKSAIMGPGGTAPGGGSSGGAVQVVPRPGSQTDAPGRTTAGTAALASDLYSMQSPGLTQAVDNCGFDPTCLQGIVTNLDYYLHATPQPAYPGQTTGGSGAAGVAPGTYQIQIGAKPGSTLGTCHGVFNCIGNGLDDVANIVGSLFGGGAPKLPSVKAPGAAKVPSTPQLCPSCRTA